MKDIDKVAVGQRIKRMRLEMGYNKTEFGKMFKATGSLVYKWEQGMVLPNEKRLSDIAFYGQMNVNELLTGKKETTIDALALFYQQNDIRKYLSVGVDDDEVAWLENQFDINYETVETVLGAATIYVNMSDLPEEITVIKNI